MSDSPFWGMGAHALLKLRVVMWLKCELWMKASSDFQLVLPRPQQPWDCTLVWRNVKSKQRGNCTDARRSAMLPSLPDPPRHCTSKKSSLLCYETMKPNFVTSCLPCKPSKVLSGTDFDLILRYMAFLVSYWMDYFMSSGLWLRLSRGNCGITEAPAGGLFQSPEPAHLHTLPSLRQRR